VILDDLAGGVAAATNTGDCKFTIANTGRTGGTHRIENLEPLCWDCHHLIHKVERSQWRIADRTSSMIAFVSEIGGSPSEDSVSAQKILCQSRAWMTKI
jgi:hypothetical protein